MRIALSAKRDKMEQFGNVDKHFRDALVDVIPCSVFMVDKDHKIIYWNKSAEQLTGYDASEIVGATCGKFRINICAYQDVSIRETFCPLLSGGNSGEVECELLSKDGSVIPFEGFTGKRNNTCWRGNSQTGGLPNHCSVQQKNIRFD